MLLAQHVFFEEVEESKSEKLGKSGRVKSGKSKDNPKTHPQKTLASLRASEGGAPEENRSRARGLALAGLKTRRYATYLRGGKAALARGAVAAGLATV
jgi:hypothetical protein